MLHPPPADATDLVAVSYNVHKGVGTDGRRRPERILDVIEETGADIAVLQEADLRFGVRAAVLPADLLAARGFRALPFDRKGVSLGWHGNAVLVRSPVTPRRQRRIRLPAIEPRGAVLADLEIAGRLLRVAGMHLDLSGLRRRRQILSVLQRLAAAPGDPPALLMGDMNEWRDTAEPLRVLAAGFQPVPLGPSFPARLPIGRLDRIFASRHLPVVDAGVHASPLARVASDHLPVWVRVRLGPG
jgi:endonuclease/exonuclease/phosphatase family metal-dependent hydrolase